jgi:hypothetical protein
MRFIHALGAIIALLGSSGSTLTCATNPNPVIDLGYAKYEGFFNATSESVSHYFLRNSKLHSCGFADSKIHRINTWYGIRYAQPPTGPLRWQAPQDIEASSDFLASGTINATVQGPSCVQGFPAWSAVSSPTGSEDCLLLDVMVPANPASSLLPVMVQIHGGGMLCAKVLPPLN